MVLKEAKEKGKSSDCGKGTSVDYGIGRVKGDDDSRQGEDGNDEDASLHERFRFDGEFKLQFHSLIESGLAREEGFVEAAEERGEDARCTSSCPTRKGE